MKILIIGSNLNTLLLAKYIKMQSENHDIYTAGDMDSCDKIYTASGIKENDIEALRDFVKYNGIDLTLVSSEIAVINGIADLFAKEGFLIAAPFSEAARAVFFNSTAKKVMYKLKINTPRFGIFDRESIAADYLRRTKFPVIIMNDFTLNERKRDIYPSFRKARAALQKIYENKSEKIVIENYIDENPLYIYFLTDGYNAVKLISLERNEFGDFIEIKAPDKRITQEMSDRITEQAVFPLLDDIAKYSGVYSGILGMKIIIQKDNFYVLEFYDEFQSCDLQTFLSLLDEDLSELFRQAASKELVSGIDAQLKNESSYTIAFKAGEVSDALNDFNDDDFYIFEDGRNFVITKTSASMNTAKRHLYEYLEAVCRQEIYEEIINNTKEVLKV